jgi:hypothetical protein
VYGGYEEGKFPQFDPKTGKENTKNFRSGSHPWWIKWNGDASFSNIQATGGTVGGWTIGKDHLKAGNLKLSNDGDVLGPNWHIKPDGDAWFSQIHGQIMSGYALKGNGITLGGGGAPNGTASGGGVDGNGTSLNPSVVGCPTLAGLGGAGTLGGQLKIQFDKLYAKEAEIGNLKVLNSLSFAGKSIGWASAVVNASLKALRNPKGQIVGISLTLYRWEFLTGSIGWSNTASALAIPTQYEG